MKDGVNVTKWFYEEPIDFESKKYRLLGSVSKAQEMIDAGDIHEAMDFIEDHLVCFYKFKTEKELMSYDDRDIVGIDPVLMRIIWDTPQKDNSKEIEILCDIAELGVLEFEALHSLFRIKWRDIDDALKVSYIPERPLLISNGYAFVSNSDEDWTRLYTFLNPSDCEEWKDFDLKLVEQTKYYPNKILDFVSTLKENGNQSIILNCNLNKSFNSIESIDFVLKCKLYYRLLKDYMF
ncbi:MAG: hypothetical protein CMP57_01870 [Flavobacteriales bacterium]|nr:hypothetical protein [Flavobacteriales bacterium]|tara:strand:- start:490 stop:1197 length:708 start_codon:yes stop_codon:yes gene_type:complete